MMKAQHVNRIPILLFVVSIALTSVARAQDSPAPAQEGGQQPAAPAPAFGPDNPSAPMTENPPISGLDQPGLEPHAAPLSYLQPGAHISEAADSNVANTLGSGGGIHSVTRALGSLELQRLWSRYDLALDYVGGVGYYSDQGIGLKQLQQLNVDQRINWKRGQLSLRDSFSYLPEGNFTGAYGSLSTSGQALGSVVGSSFFGGSVLGGLGEIPRITNLSLVEVRESLTPKSAVTVSGGYSFVHYTGSDPGVDNIPFLGSKEVSAQIGYNRIVGPHDQVALMYGYQGFDFSTSAVTAFNTSFHTHLIQAMWGHRISGRMDFRIGAGPQITEITQTCSVVDVLLNNPHCSIDAGGNPVGGIPNHRLTVAGRASLRYRFPRASLDAVFERYTTAGSGIFAGANSNIARLSVTRPLTRVWTLMADIGYAHNSRLQQLTAEQTEACTVTPTNPTPPPCPGTLAKTYAVGFAGLGVHRQLGHDFRVYASYQFNYLTLDKSFCGGSGACERISNRHVGSIGLDWTPRPIRLD